MERGQRVKLLVAKSGKKTKIWPLINSRNQESIVCVPPLGEHYGSGTEVVIQEVLHISAFGVGQWAPVHKPQVYPRSAGLLLFVEQLKSLITKSTGLDVAGTYSYPMM